MKLEAKEKEASKDLRLGTFHWISKECSLNFYELIFLTPICI